MISDPPFLGEVIAAQVITTLLLSSILFPSGGFIMPGFFSTTAPDVFHLEARDHPLSFFASIWIVIGSP